MSKSYKLGQQHNKMGYSMHYNPYRNKGTGDQFTDWENGYNSQNNPTKT